MKRLFSIILSIVLCVGLPLAFSTGCKDTGDNDEEPHWEEELPLALANTYWIFQESDNDVLPEAIYFDATGTLCINAVTNVPYLRYLDDEGYCAWRLVEGFNADIGMIDYGIRDMYLDLDGTTLTMTQWNALQYAVVNTIVWKKDEERSVNAYNGDSFTGDGSQEAKNSLSTKPQRAK